MSRPIGHQRTIEAFHNMIHEGKTFSCEWEDTDSDIAAPSSVLLEVGECEAHLVVEAACTQPFTMTVTEAPTVSDTGTNLVIYNMKRESDEVSLCDASHSAASTGGTVISKAREYGSGSNPNKRLGGAIRTNSEWILKENTKYVFTVTPDADNSKVYIGLEWYELPE